MFRCLNCVKLFSLLFAAAFIVTAARIPAFAASATLADWLFSESGVMRGTLEGGNLQLEDLSGNGNDLVMRTYGAGGGVSFSDDEMYSDQGSMFFNGSGANGSDFVTVDSAPINSEQFQNGYTFEIVYKMPEDWTTKDRWTSLISRLGKCTTIDDEGEDITSTITVSNCKEIQVIASNAADSHTMSSAAWSIAMDKAQVWYHIVVTCDNNVIRTFVNGCESFRDYVSNNAMRGLYADPADGRFRIASRVMGGYPYRFTRGYIQQIRISSGVLDRSGWLVQNPEDYIGEYGSSEPFRDVADGNYNLVFLPDIQNTVKFKSDVIMSAVNWMVQNKTTAQIKAVAALGDLVEDYYDDTQWSVASNALMTLAGGGIPTLAVAGNHDDNSGTNTWYYNKYFGAASAYMSLMGERVTLSPSGMSSYMKVDAGSYTYLIISLGMYMIENAAETAWFENALRENASLPAIVVSHDLQNCSSSAPNEIALSLRGLYVWEMVRRHDNVFMMIGGHSHGYGNEVLTNDYGNDVFSILADYQFSYNGGNALFKFAEFDERNNRINLSTFSPYAASMDESDKTFFDVTYMTGKGNDDVLEINFAQRFTFDTPTISYKENLIDNYDFETSAQGWTCNNAGSISAAAWTVSDTVSHSGSKSLKQTVSGGSATANNIGTYFPIEPGKRYRLSFWEYSTIAVPAGFSRMSAASVVTRISALGDLSCLLPECGGFNSWYNESIGALTRDNAYAQGWTQRVYYFDTTNAPAARYVLIAYAWGEANTFYIDDFELCEYVEDSSVAFDRLWTQQTQDAVRVFATLKNLSDTAAFVAIAAYDEQGVLQQVAVSEAKKVNEALFATCAHVRAFCLSDALVPLCAAAKADAPE